MLRVQRIADFAVLTKTFPNGSKPRGRPKTSTIGKSQVTRRLDMDIIQAQTAEHYSAEHLADQARFCSTV